jgi:hypothetical protein
MTASNAREDTSPPYWPSVKLGTVSLLIVAGLHLTASVVLQTFFGADFVETRLNRSLPGEMKTHYRIDVGAVRWSLWNCSMQVSPLALYPEGAGTDGAPSSPPRYTAFLSTLRLKGVEVWPLLWKGIVSLDKVVVERPLLRRTVGPNERTEQGGRMDPSRKIQTTLTRRLPPLRIGRVQIRKGRIIALTERERGTSALVTDVLWGLSLRADRVRTEGAAQEEGRVLLSDSTRGSIDGYRHLSTDSLYTVNVGPTSVSSTDSSLIVEHFQVGPTVADTTLMRRRGHRTNRIAASIRRGEVQGVDVRRFLEDRSVSARKVLLDSLRVDVYRNNHLPPPPTDPPPQMPHEVVRGLERTLRVDTIRVTDGFARYSKWPAEADAPGHISFEAIDATIRNVTNDPDRMSPSTPAVIDATTRVAGAGRLHAIIRVPLLAPHLSLRYNGRMGPMDVRAFNDAFVHLSGARVETGHIDSLWFSANVERGRARGTVHSIYQDFNVELLDKETGERGLGKRVRTLVLNGLLLKSNNTRSGSLPRAGTIDHKHEKGDTFFKFLWHSVRSGLFSLVGL